MCEPSDDKLHDLFRRLREGDRQVENELIDHLGGVLRRLASKAMRREPANHTWQTTALIGEAWIRLFQGSVLNNVDDRQHFERLAGRVMRNLLVDHARRKHAEKRIPPDKIQNQGPDDDFALDWLAEDFSARNQLDAVDLDDAIQKLRGEGLLSDRQLQIIEHRFFMGRTVSETADVLGVSAWTVEQDWRIARNALYVALKDE